ATNKTCLVERFARHPCFGRIPVYAPHRNARINIHAKTSRKTPQKLNFHSNFWGTVVGRQILLNLSPKVKHILFYYNSPLLLLTIALLKSGTSWKPNRKS